jgi:hypothetical protein
MNKEQLTDLLYNACYSTEEKVNIIDSQITESKYRIHAIYIVILIFIFFTFVA